MGKYVIAIGIGGCGVKTVRAFARKAKALNLPAACFSFDTDAGSLQIDDGTESFSLARAERLFEAAQMLDEVQLKAWFPLHFEDTQNEFIKMLRMDNGTGMWRSKALLHFACYMVDPQTRDLFWSKLKLTIADCLSSEIEVYVVASLAGGTGSALFLPITLYLQKLMREFIGRRVDVRAFLYSPELFTAHLSAEQQVKANANAYAALRELNAVHMAATAAFEGAPTASSGIRFTLGSAEDSAIGLLFDAGDPAFRIQVAMPFSSIYIMERQAGIRSLDPHMEILSDVLVSLCGDESALSADSHIRKDPEKLFGAIMLAKVIYPKESMAEYIAAERLCNTVQKEWLFLHKQVMRALQSEGTFDAKTAAPAADRNSRYCVALLKCIEDLPLGEDAETDIFAKIASAKNVGSEYLDAIERSIGSYLCGEGAKNFSEIKDRVAAAFAAPSIFGRVHFSLFDAASDCKSALRAVYREANKAFRTHADDFRAAIEAQEGELSLTEHILHEHGGPLHPVLALARLSALRTAIDAAQGDLPGDLSLADEADDLLPDSAFFLPPPPETGKKCKYGCGGEERFLLLIDRNRLVGGKTTADLALFDADLERLNAAMTAPVKSAFLQLLSAQTNARIEQYIRFFCRLDSAADSMATFQNAALRKDSYADGICCYVFASETDRRLAAASFARAVAEDGEHDIFTPDFYSKTEDAVLRGVLADDFLAALAAELTAAFKGSAFYKQHLDKNILDVLLNPDPAVCAAEGGRDLRMRKAFHAAAPYLKTTLPDTGRGMETWTRTFARLSKKTGEFLQDHAADFGLRGEDPRAIIENLLYMSDEYADDISFYNEIPGNCMYIRKELGNLRLGDIEFFNEAAQPPVGKNDCAKALHMMQTQYTEMWNPFLFCHAESGLPLICADLQEKRERQMVKALLFALENRQILSVTDPSTGAAVYHCLHNGFAEPILVGDKAVEAEDFVGLPRWLRQDGTPSPYWENAFDEQLKKECGGLPSADLGNMRFSAVLEAVDQTQTVRMLCNDLLAIAFAAENARIRDRVLYTGLETVAALCGSRFSATDLSYAEMFRHICTQITERFREWAGDAYGAEHLALIDEFNAQAATFLPRYDEP